MIDSPHKLSSRFLIWPVERVGSKTILAFNDAREFFGFCKEIWYWTFRRPFRSQLLWQQLDFIGNQSLNILLISSLSVGAVFGLLVGGVFQVFRAENLLGGVTAKALCMELGPMTTLILLAGRAGSSMCAEIAIMKVNEQVDALESMGVDPVSYLVVPRVLASAIIMPLLTSAFIFVGIFGAYIVGTVLFNVDQGLFLEKITRIVEERDLWRGLVKSIVFAIIMAIICCRYGLVTKGGAKGVGVSTTKAVVSTLLAVLAVDVVITYFQVIW